ncbi:hypothetical protein [Bacillus wiedmannii]|uniref:hypothetical protein n=1 Tax=Bacillus wiedmannii TaxID=1890302 RepID=UPI000BEF9EE1|nr:hypothetical protein [Bacillus wiedmannii]PEL85034.1 hypothetical protein CN626_28040 [Bacillus wiedmannii]
MIEKYTTEIVIDVYRKSESDLESMVDEIKAYTKTYEHDKVTVVGLKKEDTYFTDKEQYVLTLQVERDTLNLGRKYEYEEEKLFGFYEDEEN